MKTKEGKYNETKQRSFNRKVKDILNNTKKNLEEMLCSFYYYFLSKKMSIIIGTDLT